MKNRRDIQLSFIGGENEAKETLINAGYVLREDKSWVKPTKDHRETEREKDAIAFLHNESGYGKLD